MKVRVSDVIPRVLLRALRLTAIAATVGIISTSVTRAQVTSNFVTVYSFGTGDASSPAPALIQANDGNFYGVTWAGSAGNGTIFQLTPNGTFTTLHTFDVSDGQNPYAALLQANDGTLYGTTEKGGDLQGYNEGVLFDITLTGSLTNLYNFTGQSGSGATPFGTLIQARDGYLYGTTAQGGINDQGTIFRSDLTGALTTLHEFSGNDGAGPPREALLQGADGNFYGTTSSGGANNYGNVFQFTPEGTLTVLHSFSSVEGATNAGVIEAPDGNFYGTTMVGGSNGYGTVFQLTPSGTLTILHTFNNSDGGTLKGALIRATDGNFYGTTAGGGSNNLGTLFQITPSGSLTVLHSFSGGNEGRNPECALLQASDGSFYGTTLAGGANDTGTIFRLIVSPSLASAAGATATVNQPFTYQITATNTPTLFSASGLPAGLTVNASTGVISGTPTVSGTFNVGLFAQNSGGTGSATLTLTITSAPIPAVPTINSVASASAVVGVSFSYAVTATNAPTSFAAAGLPAGLTIDPSSGLISGAATGAGTFVVSLSATNAAGAGTAALTLTVTLPPGDIESLSILSPPAGISIAQSETINLEVSVGYQPGTLKSLVMDVVNAPGTAAYDTILNQSTVDGFTQSTWMPNNVPAGNYFLRATATDVTGAAPYFEQPITVIASPAAPPTSKLLSGLDGKTFAAGSTLPLVGLATDASGAPIPNATFYVNNTAVPAGASSTAAARPGELQPKDAVASQFSQASYQAAVLGDAILTLAAKDNNGVTGISAAATLHITAAGSGAVPTCAITSPATGAQTVTGAGVQVAATATESSGSIAQVEFFSNDTSEGTVTAPPYTKSIPMPMAGRFALTAIATDTRGISQASAPVIVTVATPVVTIAVAGDGEAVAGGKKGKATVTRTGDTSAPLIVRFKIAGAVEAGVDYEALSKLKVTIPAGESQAKIKLTALSSPRVESARVAKITLLPSANGAYTLGAEAKAKIKLIEN